MSIQFNLQSPTIEDDMYITAVKLIYVMDRIDSTDQLSLNVKPTILIFLPGIYEIGAMNRHIEESAQRL